jgi:hypothetical protein
VDLKCILLGFIQKIPTHGIVMGFIQSSNAWSSRVAVGYKGVIYILLGLQGLLGDIQDLGNGLVGF